VIDKARVQEGAAVNTAFMGHAFRNEAFMKFVSALAAAPMAEADRVDLNISIA
jgi:hypothetical protein